MTEGGGNAMRRQTGATRDSFGLARAEDFQVSANDGGCDFLGLSDRDVEVQGRFWTDQT